jgi:hypothetical protein
MSEDKQKLL